MKPETTSLAGVAWNTRSAAWNELCDHTTKLVNESRKNGSPMSRPEAFANVCQQHVDLSRAAQNVASAPMPASAASKPAAACTDPYRPLAEQRAKDKGISFHAAYQQVVAENPKLYERYQTELQALNP